LARFRKPFFAADRFLGDVFFAVEADDLRFAVDLASDAFAVVFFADDILRAGAFVLGAAAVFFVDAFFVVEAFLVAELLDRELVFFVDIFKPPVPRTVLTWNTYAFGISKRHSKKATACQQGHTACF
jgi:hypothetical protein